MKEATPRGAAEPSVTAAPIDLATQAVSDLLLQANRRYEALDFDDVIPLAQEVLRRPEATVDQQLDAYLLEASAMAVVGNPIDAEKPFRFLLRGRPDYEMPASTTPKILAVFRKVQVEEKAIRQQLRELALERQIASLAIEGAVESSAGGRALPFAYRLTDPHGVVNQLSVLYRRAGEAAFSSLALKRGVDGTWAGELAGAWTASPEGFTLEYYLSTFDREGQGLLQVATEADPMRLAITPGSVPDAAPFYRTWWFWGATVGVLASGAVATWLLVDRTTRPPDSDLGDIRVR